jgi:hypothetical protein
LRQQTPYGPLRCRTHSCATAAAVLPICAREMAMIDVESRRRTMIERTYAIKLDELMEICLQLDRVIKQKEKQETEWIDHTKGKELSDIDVWMANTNDSELLRLRALRDRLFNMIPQDYL